MSGVRKRFERLSWSAKTGRAFNHGKVPGYATHGCGCEPCWVAYANSNKYLRELALHKAVTAAGGSR